MPGVRTLAPGLGLAVAVAVVAYGISHLEPRISALVAALLLGMVVSNVVAGRRATLTPGARFAARRILRVGIALLGLRISLELIGDVGWRGVVVAVAAVGFTLPFTVWLGRRLGEFWPSAPHTMSVSASFIRSTRQGPKGKLSSRPLAAT